MLCAYQVSMRKSGTGDMEKGILFYYLTKQMDDIDFYRIGQSEDVLTKLKTPRADFYLLLRLT